MENDPYKACSATRSAIGITGRNVQLFTESDDLQWARDVHNVPAEATGVITIGNEDCPDAVWFTVEADPNYMGAIYGRI